jgi:hypothetical protein
MHGEALLSVLKQERIPGKNHIVVETRINVAPTGI